MDRKKYEYKYYSILVNVFKEHIPTLNTFNKIMLFCFFLWLKMYFVFIASMLVYFFI